jgi:hypothetical protein
LVLLETNAFFGLANFQFFGIFYNHWRALQVTRIQNQRVGMVEAIVCQDCRPFGRDKISPKNTYQDQNLVSQNIEDGQQNRDTQQNINLLFIHNN